MGEIVAAAPSAFDRVAAGYDADFEAYAAPLRSVMLEAMLRTFRPGDHILDLNCGTGTDALALASRGFRVTAVDGSPQMLEALKRKLEGFPAAARIDARVLSFAELSRLPAGKFDGVLSNFGGLNCAEDLPAVLGSLVPLLRPRAAFIACLLNTVCLWEIASFAARLNVRGALRRFDRKGASARIGAEEIVVRYYSPRAFRRMLEPSFSVERMFGLSIFSPPPGSRHFIARHPLLVRNLARLDDRIRMFYPFHALGDHMAVIARLR